MNKKRRYIAMFTTLMGVSLVILGVAYIIKGIKGD